MVDQMSKQEDMSSSFVMSSYNFYLMSGKSREIDIRSLWRFR